ncbi:hypothetical protein IWQ60_000340 [Tieghemiomyces parasiticus]|uniref:Zn(2)-C6 fungal-type domain-containing protein n=1 Tax=Tieghemiomyces parasiticus TaxID=78921 RepID=A0A9W8AF01_9FUNG|nr:hypothetical protein IWQ60_000340 [Tieghemiomyces parasiticus]
MKGRAFDHFIFYSHPDHPGLKRRSYACDNCRKKKVRCNGEQPACDNCTKKNMVCEYPNRRARPDVLLSSATGQELVASGPESPTYSVNDQDNGPAADSHSSGRPRSPNAPSVAVATTVSITRPSPECVAELQPLSPVTARFPGVSIPKSPESEVSADRRHSPTESASSDQMAELQESMAALMGLPRALIIRPEVQVWQVLDYFEYFHPQVPMIHKWTFMQRLMHNEVSTVLLYGIYAVSSRFSRRPNVVIHDGPYAGQRYSKLVLEIAEREHENPTLELLQGTVLASIAAGIALEVEMGAHLGKLAYMMAYRLGGPAYLQSITEDYLHTISQAAAIELESLRRTYLTVMGVSLFGGIVYEQISREVTYPLDLLWTNDDNQWGAITLDPPSLLLPPRQVNFRSSSHMVGNRLMYNLHFLYLSFEDMQTTVGAERAAAHRRFHEYLGRIDCDDQRLTTWFNEAGPEYEDWEWARSIGLGTIRPYSRLQASHRLLRLADALQLPAGDVQRLRADLVKAASDLCGVITRQPDLSVAYTYTWVPHFVFLATRLITGYVEATEELYPGAHQTMVWQLGILQQYHHKYKCYWNTDFAKNFEERDD